MLNLPNILTILRILLVPMLVVVLLTKFEGKEFVGLAVFLSPPSPTSSTASSPAAEQVTRSASCSIRRPTRSSPRRPSSRWWSWSGRRPGSW